MQSVSGVKLGVSLSIRHIAISDCHLVALFLSVKISDHGDFRVSVNRLPACYPDIISQRCSGRLCGSVGQLIVFKHNYYEERDQTKPNHGQDSCTLQKWTVIVPGKIIHVLIVSHIPASPSGRIVLLKTF